MTTLDVTVTEEELAQLRVDHPANSHNYPDPAEGYVRGTDVAKALNELLKQHGREDRSIKPQMVYNYLRKGYIKTDQYPHVSVAEAQRFIKIQLARRTA